MKIGGLQKFSLIDYPGKISAVVFVQGCNFRCPYCHNRELVLPEHFSTIITEEEVLEFLEIRKGKIEGVVITGGEPTIFPDLPDFLTKTKRLGYYTKLDTNGSNPEMLKLIIERKLVDYIAMDIKAPLEKYKEITCSEVEVEKITHSMELIKTSGIEYEFRTTVIYGVHTYTDILKICNLIKESNRYVLQNFYPSQNLVDQDFQSKIGFPEEELSKIEKKLSSQFKHFYVRN
ncbi:MAG: anaerobic ribonucleoside-triphosphate reductase activating protein [Persephonella sp.]|nr:anaerobic ribonucleoside-triphosphate reductase activating protein [Persephonella sp.]